MDHDQEQTGEGIISPILASNGGPAEIAAKDLTVEAGLHAGEPLAAGAKTAAGTDPVSNAVTYSESTDPSASQALNHRSKG